MSFTINFWLLIFLCSSKYVPPKLPFTAELWIFSSAVYFPPSMLKPDQHLFLKSITSLNIWKLGLSNQRSLLLSWLSSLGRVLPKDEWLYQSSITLLILSVGTKGLEWLYQITTVTSFIFWDLLTYFH